MDVEMQEKGGLTTTKEICAICQDAEMREIPRKADAFGFVGKVNLLDLREIISPRN